MIKFLIIYLNLFYGKKLGSITYEILIIHIPCIVILNYIGIYGFIDESMKLFIYLLFCHLLH